MSSRTDVLVAILDQVEANKLGSDPIDVSATAKKVSSMHPQCGMAIDEIEQVVAGIAVRAGVSLFVGNRAA